MVGNPTFGINSTYAGARVFAFVIQACLVSGAVCVCYTFRPTSTVWIPEVFGQADTRASPISLPALRVGSTRGRSARRSFFFHSRSYWYGTAPIEWIPSEPSLALAMWGMVGYHTLRIKTTRTRTRIFASFVDTGQVPGTFLIDGAFRPAVGGSPNVIRQTRTDCLSINGSTLRVGPTWCGLAWIGRINLNRGL